MPFARTDDGVKLYYEETGAGAPLVFVHEFAADHRSWELQMRHFGQRYRCITFGARGYPPSDVPEKPDAPGISEPPPIPEFPARPEIPERPIRPDIPEAPPEAQKIKLSV